MTSQVNDIVVFEAANVATIGNQFLNGILMHEASMEAAKAEIVQGEKRENFIDFEMTKAVLFLHGTEAIDLYKLYGDKKASQVLYRQILTELGVLAKTITDEDTVEYSYTDPSLKDQFFLDGALKETDEAEYLRRRSRRNSLNIRLARVRKAAIALHDANATPDDLVYRDNDDGSKSAVITKGPRDIMGEGAEVSINSDARKPLEGAKFSPSITGLAKMADSAHKEVAPSKDKAETDAGKAGEGVNGEADFLATVNTLVMMIKGREGKFAKTEETALRSLASQLKEANLVTK
jgi:hypothetical protein